MVLPGDAATGGHAFREPLRAHGARGRSPVLLQRQDEGRRGNQGGDSIDIWILRLDLRRNLRQRFKMRLGMHSLAVI